MDYGVYCNATQDHSVSCRGCRFNTVSIKPERVGHCLTLDVIGHDQTYRHRITAFKLDKGKRNKMTDIKSKLRIAECIKLAGISKTTFYKKYIHGGLVSVSKDEHGNKFIDRSEFIRVFPNAGSSANNDKGKRTKSDENELIAMLKDRVDELNTQLTDEKQRNHELMMKLLDAPAQQRTPPEPEKHSEPLPEKAQPAKKRSRLFRVLEALTD